MPDLTGQVLQGRYRIDHLIGRGGMAEVYKAYDTRRQYPVAIKVMREDLAEDVEFIHRFRREAQALAALSHANIVRFYSFGRQGRLAFIVMDLIQGSTLRGIILDAEGAPLLLDQVAAFTHQIAAALHYAHDENILHRDIKPGNIMVQPTGQVLVADFGIAKAADAATATTVMPGTPAYMSPEQCLSQLLDPRTDVYALGIVVYEMLAGRRPFRGDSSESGSGSTRERIRWEQIYLAPPPLRSFNPALPAQVDAVVLKALEKDRRDRWPSVLAFAQAFEHALHQAGVTIVPRVPAATPLQPSSPAAPVSGSQPAGIPAGRPPPAREPAAGRAAVPTRVGPFGIPVTWLVVAAALVAVVVVVACLVGLWPDDGVVPDLVDWDLENAIRIVEQTGYRAVYPDTGDVAHSELLVAAQNPGAGERLAEGSSVYLDLAAVIPEITPTDPGPTATSSTPGTPTPTPTGTSSPTTPVTPITDTPSPTAPPITISPTIATPTPSPTPSPTGTPTPTSTGTSTPTATSTPSPEPPPAPKLEAKIAFGAKRDGGAFDVYIMNPDGSGVTQLTTHGASDSRPSWSPDGKRIAFHSDRNGSNDIFVMTRQGEAGGLDQLTSHPGNDSDPNWSPNGKRIVFISEQAGNREVYVMGSDGSNPQRLTQTAEEERRPAWSSDGKSIIFESSRTGDSQIYIMDASGNGQRPLTSSPGDDISPRWAPGSRIVFASHRDPGNNENRWPEIYIMDSSGGAQSRLTSNSADDDMPTWSADGNWIVFSSKTHSCPGQAQDRACDWDLYKMRANGSDRQRVSNTPRLSEVSSAWWAP